MYKSILTFIFLFFSISSFASGKDLLINDSDKWQIYKELDSELIDLQIEGSSFEELKAQATTLIPGQYIARIEYGENSFKNYIVTVNNRGEIEPQVIAAITRFILRKAAKLLTQKNSWAYKALITYTGKLVGKSKAERVIGAVSNGLSKAANKGATSITKIKDELSSMVRAVGVPKYLADDIADAAIDIILLAL